MSSSPHIKEGLAALRHTLQQLLQAHRQLQAQHAKLEKQHAAMAHELARQKAATQALQQQTDVLKLGIQHWSAPEKKLLEKKIDVYLKDIEKCMALLNS